jgi:hypothetical protein
MSLQNWVAQRVPTKPQRAAALGTTSISFSVTKSTSSRKTQSRSFLDLPTEIRLLIYEAIFTPASVVLQSGEPYAIIALPRNFPELISRGFRDVQLFRTCRICHVEAAPIFYSSINLLVYQHLPLLRLNFLPRIGPLNASFIKRAMITPIGLPGEHQRLLESLGSRNYGLTQLESLTLEIWDPEHVPTLVSTCQELIQRHDKLKIIFGRGIEMDGPHQAGDIPARLILAKQGQSPNYRVCPLTDILGDTSRILAAADENLFSRNESSNLSPWSTHQYLELKYWRRNAPDNRLPLRDHFPGSASMCQSPREPFFHESSSKVREGRYRRPSVV